MAQINYKGKTIDVKTGDVILFRNEFVLTRPMTWLSTAIRFFTGVKYNHAGVAVSTWDLMMINEAYEFGVVSRPLELHLERRKSSILILRAITLTKEKDFATRAHSALGKKYDFSSLLIHQLIYRITGIWIGREKEGAEKSMVCTEYVAWCHKMRNWWKASAKELLADPCFYTVFEG